MNRRIVDCGLDLKDIPFEGLNRKWVSSGDVKVSSTARIMVDVAEDGACVIRTKRLHAGRVYTTAVAYTSAATRALIQGLAKGAARHGLAYPLTGVGACGVITEGVAQDD